MSAIIIQIFLGWTCSKRDCNEKFHIDPHKNWDAWSPEPRRAAREHGWTFWIGRSNRIFCPKHVPAKGSKMVEDKR